MDYFFSLSLSPPFPLLTKPRNPLPEVKPSLQQGSFPRLFTLNIFWPAEIGGGGRPSAPPGLGLRGAAAPPTLPRQQYGSAGTGATCAAQLSGNLLRALASPPAAGGGKPLQGFSAGGTPLRGQLPCRRSEDFTKAQLWPRRRPAALPPSRPGAGVAEVATRGRRGGKEAEGSEPGTSRGEAGSELKLSREI